MKSIEKKISTPTKVGQIVKFHTPYPDENPNQLYVLLEIFEYDESLKPKADIKALNTGLSFPPISTVLLEDLELAEVETTDLIGFRASIKKDNHSIVSGKVIEVVQPKQMVDLSKIGDRVETNVSVTIQDTSGNAHDGFLTVIF
ncbi:hypothetical protein [Algoriphagus antarcticus]|uniref:Uncharacterized protein n=1 Tax=Algoriphagus antarcticus TaxID=238540 RepID=A0A3E0E7S8_9BACT|nr:hypothetical protein [Algoriphagus antarcticus]REG94308.1 hypothetical protein C8N25_101133 [Algoriphagus antarcticus]